MEEVQNIPKSLSEEELMVFQNRIKFGNYFSLGDGTHYFFKNNSLGNTSILLDNKHLYFPSIGDVKYQFDKTLESYNSKLPSPN